MQTLKEFSFKQLWESGNSSVLFFSCAFFNNLSSNMKDCLEEQEPNFPFISFYYIDVDPGKTTILDGAPRFYPSLWILNRKKDIITTETGELENEKIIELLNKLLEE